MTSTGGNSGDGGDRRRRVVATAARRARRARHQCCAPAVRTVTVAGASSARGRRCGAAHTDRRSRRRVPRGLLGPFTDRRRRRRRRRRWRWRWRSRRRRRGRCRPGSPGARPGPSRRAAETSSPAPARPGRARADRPPVGGPRRVVRLAALPTGGRRRAGERQRAAGLGREGDRRRAREQGRRRVIPGLPGLVPGGGRFIAGRHLHVARAHGREGRGRRARRSAGHCGRGRGAHGARAAPWSSARTDRRSGRRAPGTRPRRVPRARTIGRDPVPVPGRPDLGRGLHLARHLLRRGHGRPHDPADDRVRVRPAR